ncbi:MAG TPA: hypothetical protein VL172_03100 [Kofleriaceae bacterium]|jgi:hypothetical protein|nr:hypothetical protein [Kofleriaceae bacterium]
MSRRPVGEFLERFVLPLVRGGELVVGDPIDAEQLQGMIDDLPHASDALVAVDEARTDVLAELVVRPPALVLDADELQLAAALHDVLFLSHPRTDSWAVTGGALRKVGEAARRFAAQPLSTDRVRVLARHGLLHAIFAVRRTDTKVSWWTGSATFFGQRPPPRLTAWPAVRRVRTETSSSGFQELFGIPEALPVLSALLRRSPLTLLLGGPEVSVPVHWEEAVFLLRDAELARALAYRALRPRGHREMLVAPARYAAGLDQMLERGPREEDVRAVCAFLVHLNLLVALAEVRERDPGRSPLLTSALAVDRAGQRPRGLTTFFALPNAMTRVDARLAEPPGIDADTALRKRWRQHRAQVVEGVGEAVIDTLATRLRRHLHAPAQLESGGDTV